MKAQMEIVQLRKENQTLKTENSSLRGKVADLEATVRRLVQIIREKLPEVYAAISQSVIGSSHRRSRSPNQGIWNAKESGFWGILAETTGRETQVSCSVGGDGIAQKIQKSRAVRGGDLR